MKDNKEPIRVAQIIGKWFGGGVESVVMNYYRHIDRNKIQFDFICDSDSTSIPYGEIEALGGKVILIPPYQRFYEYHKELKKILKDERYEIVHSHINTLSIFSLFAAKCANVPIRIAHSHTTSNKKEIKKDLMKQMLKPFSKMFATNYMCCSELAGKWLFSNKTYIQGKVYLLNNAIDLDQFKYDKLVGNEVRRELNISKSTIVIGHIGRFVEQKNHSFLVDIFYEFHKKYHDSILLLIGQGKDFEKIKEKVKRLNLEKNVLFLGQRNDANRLYQAMDVFVLPSLYEGLPVVGVEAQASGLLCLLSSEMTKETKILNSTQMIPLTESPSYWADKIVDLQQGYIRKNSLKEISDKGFNIKIEASNLENEYLKLLK